MRNPAGLAFRTVIFIVSVVLLLASSRTFAQTAANVAVIVNDNSLESQQIAEHYAQARGVPASNVIHVKASTDEAIERDAYNKTIEQPIASAIKRAGLQDRLLYLVLTKGVPLRINGSGGINGAAASVDSELTLLYRRMVGEPVQTSGKIDNPYFLGDRSISEAVPFTHRQHDIYLVTRLDAFTVNDALALIDRSQQVGVSGPIVLDRRGAGGTSGQWTDRAAERLAAQNREHHVVTDATDAQGAGGVLGYYSAVTSNPVSSTREVGIAFGPRSIAATFASSDARTFHEPPAEWAPTTSTDRKGWFEGSGAPLVGDLIRAGVSGVSGQISEPYVGGAVHPEILFPAYLAGFNLAEAFYLAAPALSWQTVVIGDPLVGVAERNASGRSQLEEPTDVATGLPGLFSRRRLVTIVADNPGIPQKAIELFLLSQTLLEQGDRTGGKGALEQAIDLAPKATGLVMTLAQMEGLAGDWDSAIAHYKRVLESQPDNVIAMNNLAYALAVGQNLPSEGFLLAKRAARIAPRGGSVIDTLGWIEHLLGDDAAAQSHLSDAVQLEPGRPEVRFHLASVLWAAGHPEQAGKELKEALRLGPTLAERADVRELQERIGRSSSPSK